MEDVPETDTPSTLHKISSCLGLETAAMLSPYPIEVRQTRAAAPMDSERVPDELVVELLWWTCMRVRTGTAATIDLPAQGSWEHTCHVRNPIKGYIARSPSSEVSSLVTYTTFHGENVAHLIVSFRAHEKGDCEGRWRPHHAEQISGQVLAAK